MPAAACPAAWGTWTSSPSSFDRFVRSPAFRAGLRRVSAQLVAVTRRAILIVGGALLTVAVLTAVVVGVRNRPNPPSVPASSSARCDRAMVAAERSEHITELAATLDACRSSGDWLAAARDHPVRFAGTSEATVDHLAVLCKSIMTFKATPVCRDAAQRHLL